MHSIIIYDKYFSHGPFFKRVVVFSIKPAWRSPHTYNHKLPYLYSLSILIFWCPFSIIWDLDYNNFKSSPLTVKNSSVLPEKYIIQRRSNAGPGLHLNLIPYALKIHCPLNIDFFCFVFLVLKLVCYSNLKAQKAWVDHSILFFYGLLFSELEGLTGVENWSEKLVFLFHLTGGLSLKGFPQPISSS